MGGDGARRARLWRNIALAACAAIVFMVSRDAACTGKRGCRGDGDVAVVVSDTVYIHDTVSVRAPVPVSAASTGIAHVRVPAADIAPAPLPHDSTAVADSAEVALPEVQRHYSGDGYEAWVSGPVDPRLDSLHMFRTSSIVERTVTSRAPPRRWGISVGVGIVATPTRIEPGVFIGATYTFASF